jgi:hypothetical protein
MGFSGGTIRFAMEPNRAVVWNDDTRLFLSDRALEAATRCSLGLRAASRIKIEDLPADAALMFGDDVDNQAARAARTP